MGGFVHKKNVFLVSGRRMINNEPRGSVVNCVVCGEDENAIRLLMAQQEPMYWIVSVNNLQAMENQVKQIKAILSGESTNWLLLVDPAFQDHLST